MFFIICSNLLAHNLTHSTNFFFITQITPFAGKPKKYLKLGKNKAFLLSFTVYSYQKENEKLKNETKYPIYNRFLKGKNMLTSFVMC